MPRKYAATRMVTWEDVRTLASSLPEVADGTAYGRPAFRVGGKVFAGVSHEGERVLAARVGHEEREFLLRTRPEVFYSTPHYDDHPWVLVRLDEVDADTLRDVLTEAWLFRAPRNLLRSYEQNRQSD